MTSKGELEGMELVSSGLTADGLLPDPDAVRGTCPQCGDVLVSQVEYTMRGYLVVWRCWAGIGTEPKCDYRKVM